MTKRPREGKRRFQERALGNMAPRQDGHGPAGVIDENQRQVDRGPRPAPPLMSALDTDSNGILSAQELAAATAALSALDKNKDGQITRDELRPAPASSNTPEAAPHDHDSRPPAGETPRPEGSQPPAPPRAN